MSDKFGIGVVGIGMAAKPHMKSLDDLRDTVDVRGVFSRQPEPRAAFCRAWDFPEATSLQGLIDDPALDALIVLTPANARTAIVEAAAKAGKHILMEKPVERTTDAAQHIVSTCDTSGVTLGIVFQHRFRAGSLALRDRISAGALGDLANAYLVVPWWRPQSYYDEPGRGTLERDGGGVLISQAIHSMDLLLSLTGPVAEVQAIAGTSKVHDMETEDFVGAGLRFANGALGSIMATVANFPGDAEYMVLNFTNCAAKLSGGTLQLNWHDGRTETIGEDTATGGGADPMDFPHDWHKAQIVDFIDAVKTNRQPMSTGHTALEVHRLIDAILVSSATGQKTTVATA